MKFIGLLKKQDICANEEHKKLYAHTSIENREVILYYSLEKQCCVLKQVAIYSHVVEQHPMYWVAEYEYVGNIINVDVFKRNCLQILEKEILPYILKYTQQC